jgi:hypothetical protein
VLGEVRDYAALVDGRFSGSPAGAVSVDGVAGRDSPRFTEILSTAQIRSATVLRPAPRMETAAQPNAL